MNGPRNVHDPMIPSYETDWESIDIFVFTNGQKYSPPRKYHLQCEDLLWWETTLTGLARSQYGAMHSSIALYTLEGHPISGPMELSNGGAYVAVVPPDSFVSSGYEQYLMKASRSWEKRQTKRNSDEQLISKQDEDVPQRLSTKHQDLVKIQTPLKDIVIKAVNADEATNILSEPTSQMSEVKDQKATIDKRKPVEKRRISGETRSSILRKLNHPPVTPPASRKPINKKREAVAKRPFNNAPEPVEEASDPTFMGTRYSVPKSMAPKSPLISISSSVADASESIPMNNLNRYSVKKLNSQPPQSRNYSSQIKVLQKSTTKKQIYSIPTSNTITAPDYTNEREEPSVIKECHRIDSEIILTSEVQPDLDRQIGQIDEEEIEPRKLSISMTLPKLPQEGEVLTLVEESYEDPNRNINISHQRRDDNESSGNIYQPQRNKDSQYISIVSQNEQNHDKQGHILTSLKKGDVINLKLNIEILKRDNRSKPNLNRTCSLSQLDERKESQIGLAVCKSCDSIDTKDCFLNCNNPKVIVIHCPCDFDSYKKSLQEKDPNSYMIVVPIITNCEERREENGKIEKDHQRESRSDIVNSVKQTVMSISIPEHNSPFRQNVGCAKITSSEALTKRKRDLKNEYLVTKFVLSKIKHPSKEYIVAMRNPSQASSYNSDADQAIDKKIDFIKVVKDAHDPKVEQNACTQTDWYRMLLEVRKNNNGYKFHLPSLDVLKNLSD